MYYLEFIYNKYYYYKYPNHSNIPEQHFNKRYPFISTGVDYLGPLLCLTVHDEKEKLHKALIVIYRCAAKRAVILEVVNNANADTFRNTVYSR